MDVTDGIDRGTRISGFISKLIMISVQLDKILELEAMLGQRNVPFMHNLFREKYPLSMHLNEKIGALTMFI